MAAADLAPLEKGGRRTGRVLIFLDETGHTFRARLGTTWAPRGATPVRRRLSRRRELSSIVALEVPLDGIAARLCARHFPGTVHAAEVLATLRYCRRRFGGPLLIVWDHLNAHRARLVHDFVAAHPADFALAWWPADAPELNPEEQCNQWVKQDLLNALPLSIDELQRQGRGAFIRLAHRPELLRRFFDHAGLSVN